MLWAQNENKMTALTLFENNATKVNLNTGGSNAETEGRGRRVHRGRLRHCWKGTLLVMVIVAVAWPGRLQVASGWRLSHGGLSMSHRVRSIIVVALRRCIALDWLDG